MSGSHSRKLVQLLPAKLSCSSRTCQSLIFLDVYATLFSAMPVMRFSVSLAYRNGTQDWFASCSLLSGHLL